LAATRRTDRSGIENDVVEIDVVDVEGDVLLGLPADRLGELLLRHHREQDLLHDDRVPGDGHGDVLSLDAGRRQEAGDGLDHERRIHDGAVDDRLGGEALEAGADELVGPFLPLPELDQLDGRGADVESDEVLGFPEQHGSATLPPADSGAGSMMLGRDPIRIVSYPPRGLSSS
jgi:hypothetical protein